MGQHIKPSQEELAEQIRLAIEEAEKLKDAPVEEDEEQPETPVESMEEDETPVEPTEEDEAEPSKEEKEVLKEKLEAEKKKSSASARENQKIYAKNRVINQALVEAEELPEPTEEELAKEFSDWDEMTSVEKNLAKETVISRNWRKTISKAKEQATKIEKWNDSVESFIDDPKTLTTYPDLEGKTEEFKTYATNEQNNSVPFNILISAFLHDHGVSNKPHKGRMFERGSGGPNDRPQHKSDKITLEEARTLRETNYTKYKEYLVAGKIESNF